MFWLFGIVLSTFSISMDSSPSLVRQTGWLFNLLEALTSLTLPFSESFIKSNSSLFSSVAFLLSFSSDSKPKSLSETDLNSFSLYFASVLIANSSTSSVQYNISKLFSLTASVCGSFSIFSIVSPAA